MFKHLIYESWLEWVPWVAFGATVSIYLVCTYRAMRLRKETTQHLAMLPLDD